MERLSQFARENSGFSINILLAAYGFIIDPLLSGPARQVLFEGQTHYTFAAIVLLFVVLELVATPYKISSVFYDLSQRNQQLPLDPQTGLPGGIFGSILMTSSIFRLALSGYLITMFFASIGIDNLPERKGLLFTCMGFVFLKEVVYFGLILWRIKKPKPVTRWKVTLGNVFYLLFYDFFLTVFWGLLIVRDQTVKAQETWSIGFGLVLLAIVFCLIFLPIRLPFLIEEYFTTKTSKQKIFLALSFVLAVSAGLRPVIAKVFVGRHTSLQTAMKEPGKVKTLYLHRKRITKLPDRIGEMKELRVLYLYSNRLQTLPPEIGKLVKLEKLNLMFNRLDELPSSIGSLVKLEWLKLYKNNLRELPESLGNLKKLQLLNLRHNKLEGLPVSMGRLQLLEELLLDNNRLTSIPRSICQLKKLRTLSLRNNPLESLPSCIRNMPKLKRLNTYGTPMYRRRYKRIMQKYRKRRRKKKGQTKRTRQQGDEEKDEEGSDNFLK